MLSPRELMHRAGFEITRTPAPHTIGWNLRQLFAHERIDVVVDVGAHEGEFGTLVRNVGFHERLVSFEPARAAFATLQNVARDSRWDARRLAIGAGDGELTLNVYAGTDFASVLKPTPFGRERFTGLAAGTTEQVKVSRLDAVDLPSGRVLLKTDTQGFDGQVLDGAAGMMGDVVAVLVELSVIPVYEDAPTWVEMVTRLTAAGFEPVAMVPVSRSGGFRVIEFDGLFVRSD